MKLRKILALPLLLFGLMTPEIVSNAEVSRENTFQNLNWDLVYEDALQTSGGVVQSICATDDYIICIENVSDSPSDADIVSAYYKNNTDEFGNPVTQYSLAKRISATCWEHGNGMTYNPNTNEIYVSLYTNSTPENRGCVYVMDPYTLEFKRSIKISDDYNILGIGYKEDTNQYVIQTNAEGGYSFKLLDENFQIAEDLGEYASTAKVDNFQDLTVCGDYILNFPLTLFSGLGDFLHVYSISERQMIADPAIDFRFEGVTADEPESLCEIGPGVFLSAVTVTKEDGSRTVQFYKVAIPYLFHMNSSFFSKSNESVSPVIIPASTVQAAQSGQTPNLLPIIPICFAALFVASGICAFYIRLQRERKRKAVLARRRRTHCYEEAHGTEISDVELNQIIKHSNEEIAYTEIA